MKLARFAVSDFSTEGPVGRRFPRRLDSGLGLLCDAFHYAAETGSDPWEFAVSISLLNEVGLLETDLRYLVKKGLIEHAREVTVEGDDGRQFRPTGNLTFCTRTCVILTEHGICALCDRAFENAQGQPDAERPGPFQRSGTTIVTPQWDPDTRSLSFNGAIVKWFKWRAMNQEVILNAFQEEGWPSRIDDPLPPHPDQDAKRRLADTIKCLNNRQRNKLLRFHGDGTGEGVIWKPSSG